MLVAHARSPEGLIGALPLALDGDVLCSLAGEHSPGYDYIGAPYGLEEIWATLRDDPRWNELVLAKVPSTSPLATLLPMLARRDHCPVVVTADTRHLVEAQCSGAVLGSRGPCDRACALTWHRDW